MIQNEIVPVITTDFNKSYEIETTRFVSFGNSVRVLYDGSQNALVHGRSKVTQ